VEDIMGRRFVTRLLNRDEQAGIERWFHHDTKESTFTIETVQHLDDLREELKEEYKQTDARTPFGKGFAKRIARVPIVILERLKKTGQHPDQDAKAFHKWLDGDGRIWKTRPKSLSK
jgi:hypothetical protein